MTSIALVMQLEAMTPCHHAYSILSGPSACKANRGSWRWLSLPIAANCVTVLWRCLADGSLTSLDLITHLASSV